MLHFGLFTGLVSATTYKQNRTLFIFFLEYINGIVDNKNYFRPLNFFEVFTPRIIKKDGVFFETKSVLFRDIGLKKYIDFVGFLEEYDHLIQQDDFEEECFGWAKCKAFWSEKKNQNISKRNYLLFDKSELKRNIKQEELIFRMDLTTP
ncbi:MAG: hypothetical protein U9Q66_01830, partial [Patescibacteria group bacterium]|nr:hypothetical protein [Patescibacteria group bacterium]